MNINDTQEFSIDEVSEMMDRTVGWKECWYNNTEVTDVLNYAEKRGWVLRPSHTQIEWTEEGVMVYRTERLKELAQKEVDSGRFLPFEEHEEAVGYLRYMSKEKNERLRSVYNTVLSDALSAKTTKD